MTAHTVDVDIRADESSAWVPTELLPDAAVGDSVTCRSSHLDEPRTGVVVEIVDDATRGTFHRVSFEDGATR